MTPWWVPITCSLINQYCTGRQFFTSKHYINNFLHGYQNTCTYGLVFNCCHYHIHHGPWAMATIPMLWNYTATFLHVDSFQPSDTSKLFHQQSGCPFTMYALCRNHCADYPFYSFPFRRAMLWFSCITISYQILRPRLIFSNSLTSQW